MTHVFPPKYTYKMHMACNMSTNKNNNEDKSKEFSFFAELC